MNTTTRISIILLCIASSAFAGTSPISIKCAVGKDAEIVSFPEVSATQNREGVINAVRELSFPTKWDLPSKTTNSEGQTIMVPVTPLEFQTVDSGWVIKCKAEAIENGLIRVAGTVTFTEPELKQAVHGENSSPLYTAGPKKVMLTENKAESAIVHSSSTHFQVFALPGKPYEFKVARLNKTVPFTITCHLNK